MSQFSRRARWLEALFPPSVAPRAADPTLLSDDVSLVQPYDAGGYGFRKITFPDSVGPTLVEITEPELSIRDMLTTIGAVTSTDLFHIQENLICRILSASFIRVAGAAVAVFRLKVRAQTGSGVSEHDCMIAPSIDATTLPNSRTHIPLTTPLILPGTQVQLQMNTGDVATQYRVTFYMVVAPLGAVFRL